MASYPSLAGMPVLVTGGGGGIGAAIVLAFARQQARVAFLDLDAHGADETVAACIAGGCPPPPFELCDLRDIGAAIDATERLAGRTGPFRALINNAGNDTAQPFDAVSVADWDDRVAVNLRHQFFLAQAVAPGMAAAGGGSIVNLGSIAWMIGAPGVPVYATLKSAVSGLTKALARELGNLRIRVNAIAPGWVLTPRQLAKGRNHPEKFGQYLDRQCLKEHLGPQDVAEAALWLCADESARCSGATFTIDAGAS